MTSTSNPVHLRSVGAVILNSFFGFPPLPPSAPGFDSLLIPLTGRHDGSWNRPGTLEGTSHAPWAWHDGSCHDNLGTCAACVPRCPIRLQPAATGEGVEWKEKLGAKQGRPTEMGGGTRETKRAESSHNSFAKAGVCGTG